MSRCRHCRKAVKWIEVAEGSRLKWIPVVPKTKPLRKHVCAEKQQKPEPNQADEPWWTKY